MTRFVDGQGVTSDALFSSAGIDPQTLVTSKVDDYVPLTRAAEAFRLAASAIDNPFVGLHAAEKILPPIRHAHIFATLAAPDLRTALHKLSQHFSRVVKIPASFTEQNNFGIFEYRLNGVGHDSPELVDFVAARFLRIVEQALGRQWRPTAVQLSRTAPGYVEEHMRVFGGNIEFGNCINRIHIDGTLLSTPLPGADQTLFNILDACCERLITSSANDKGSLDRLRQYIIESLDNEGATANAAADYLGMSRGKMQRILKRQGTCFQCFLDATRKEVARHYLTETDFPLSEVALLLGFSEQSAFTRAAKRWFDVSPRQYRHQKSLSL
ncbi:MAG: AraC family transcriptional regulator [Hyphomicrobiales bacterium]|nr:AraC family transcriptional regulator [Hyphomicrobiales bacterium]